MNRHVLITGMYRSGTTLIHHLLDGHPSLKVFPLENSLFRDTLGHENLPFPKKRTLVRLLELIRSEDFSRALEFILSHEKLSLPLTDRINLSGSTGNQLIKCSFNRGIFHEKMASELMHLSREPRETLIVELFEAYLRAYFAALGQSLEQESFTLVNKCPDAGYLIDYYLDLLPESRIVHVTRDPRAVIASFKAKLPRTAYHPFFRIFPQIKLLKNSLSCGHNYENNPRVLLIRYEDLVTKPDMVMSKVANFIDIPFEECLLQPTILGQPWQSNSSNLDGNDDKHRIFVNLDKYRNKLNSAELLLIESHCQREMEQLGYILDSPQKQINVLRSSTIYMLSALLNVETYLFKMKQRSSLR